MFANRHIQVKVVKDSAQPTIEEVDTKPVINIEEISRHAQEIGKKMLLGTLVLMGAAAVLATASQVIVNACDNDNDED